MPIGDVACFHKEGFRIASGGHRNFRRKGSNFFDLAPISDFAGVLPMA